VKRRNSKRQAAHRCQLTPLVKENQTREGSGVHPRFQFYLTTKNLTVALAVEKFGAVARGDLRYFAKKNFFKLS
jgi:hypothetical protein